VADQIWLCPSRGRPGQAEELREAWEKVTGPEAELVVAVDNDDPELASYLGPVTVIPPLGWYGPILNHLAPQYAPHCKYIGFISDDHRPLTEGWAVKLAESLGGHPGVAYGNDLIKGAEVATAALLDSRIITALGYAAPEGVLHMDTDTFWTHVGAAVGNLRYLDDVIIEHCHPLAGKGVKDEGYWRVNTPERHYADRVAYQKFLATRWYGENGDLKRLMRGLGLTG
jgi:hypothetical protein